MRSDNDEQIESSMSPATAYALAMIDQAPKARRSEVLERVRAIFQGRDVPRSELQMIERAAGQ